MAISMRASAAMFAASFAVCGCSPTLPPPPVYVDMNSQAFREDLASELNAARESALESSHTVTRTFMVGWELHHGFYLMPMDDADAHITPDFADEAVLQQFFDFLQPMRSYPAGTTPPHLGKRIVCECTGIEWSFYSTKRFIVKSAKLVAI